MGARWDDNGDAGADVASPLSPGEQLVATMKAAMADFAGMQPNELQIPDGMAAQVIAEMNTSKRWPWPVRDWLVDRRAARMRQALRLARAQSRLEETPEIHGSGRMREEALTGLVWIDETASYKPEEAERMLAQVQVGVEYVRLRASAPGGHYATVSCADRTRAEALILHHAQVLALDGGEIQVWEGDERRRDIEAQIKPQKREAAR